MSSSLKGVFKALFGLVSRQVKVGSNLGRGYAGEAVEFVKFFGFETLRAVADENFKSVVTVTLRL
jgi:hypothetical protein